MTKSPTFRVETVDPSSSTMPTNSWPMRVGSVTGRAPRYGHRSEPQMQDATTRTRASVGCSIFGSGTVSRLILPGALRTVARMPPSSHPCESPLARAEVDRVRDEHTDRVVGEEGDVRRVACLRLQERLPERHVDEYAAEGADRASDADERAGQPARLAVGCRRVLALVDEDARLRLEDRRDHLVRR